MGHVALIVEGTHDAAFFGRLLRRLNYRQIRMFDDVRPYWRALIPEKFPFRRSGQLDRYVPFPDVYERQGAGPSIAVRAAGGDSQLIPTLEKMLDNIDVTNLSALGIVLDADRSMAPCVRFSHLLKGLQDLNSLAQTDKVPGLPLPLPAAPGEIVSGLPRVGIHILPDNERSGTLETILLACAEVSYPRIYRRAKETVAAIDGDCAPDDPDLRSLRKPSGRDKAAAAIIANVLEPGFSLAVAVERGRWLDGEAIADPSVALAHRFLSDLIGPAAAPA